MLRRWGARLWTRQVLHGNISSDGKASVGKNLKLQDGQRFWASSDALYKKTLLFPPSSGANISLVSDDGPEIGPSNMLINDLGSRILLRSPDRIMVEVLREAVLTQMHARSAGTYVGSTVQLP